MSRGPRDDAAEFLDAAAELFGGETARVASVLLEKARAAKKAAVVDETTA